MKRTLTRWDDSFEILILSYIRYLFKYKSYVNTAFVTTIKYYTLFMKKKTLENQNFMCYNQGS